MNDPNMTRRAALIGLAAIAASPAAAGAPAPAADVAPLERGIGGRLGAVAIDGAGRVLLAHRADERFLLCSTFKAFLVGAILRQIDRGALTLARSVPVSRADVVPYAPAVEAAVAAGAMTVEELCRAAILVSDNAAANLLLPFIGGPAGMTRFMHRLGGRASRLDRIEPALNMAEGVKDTTTPREAAQMLRALLAGPSLSAPARQRLEGWMIETRTGQSRLRAGWPAGWPSGDKTGTGFDGPSNDIAFVDVPGRGRVYVSAFLEAPGQPGRARDEVIAAVARAVAATLG